MMNMIIWAGMTGASKAMETAIEVAMYEQMMKKVYMICGVIGALIVLAFVVGLCWEVVPMLKKSIKNRKTTKEEDPKVIDVDCEVI